MLKKNAEKIVCTPTMINVDATDSSPALLSDPKSDPHQSMITEASMIPPKTTKTTPIKKLFSR